MLPAYQGAVYARLKAELAETEPRPGDEHEAHHWAAQEQPVASAEQIAHLTAKMPGVGAWGEVVKAQ